MTHRVTDVTWEELFSMLPLRLQFTFCGEKGTSFKWVDRVLKGDAHIDDFRAYLAGELQKRAKEDWPPTDAVKDATS